MYLCKYVKLLFFKSQTAVLQIKLIMNLLIILSMVVFTAAAPHMGPGIPELITGGNSYIVGGEDATPGQFPWIGSLLYSFDPHDRHTCGCVYIGENWVLTAAHCVGSRWRSVWLGINDHRNRTGGQFFSFERVIQHPHYGQGPGFVPHDIMLCELSGVPDTSGNVAAAELAEGDEDYAGSLAIISGWGLSCADIDCGLEDVLQYSEIRILPNYGANSCESYWGEGSILDGHICVKSDDESSSACTGDSGGPVSIGNTVLGVHTGGDSDCHPSVAQIYARVSHYRDWIREVSGI